MDRHLEKTIRKCLKNDRRAQFELYKLCFEGLMNTCRRYKRNREDAVSLLNEGFLKILLNLESYNSDHEFMPWASTVMVRTAIDDYRKNKKYQSDTELSNNDAELEEVSMSASQWQAVDELTEDEIKEILFSLPEHLRLVFTLYEWEGYQHREIAEKLNVTERSTKRYLKAAKLHLKEKLMKHFDLKKVI